METLQDAGAAHDLLLAPGPLSAPMHASLPIHGGSVVSLSCLWLRQVRRRRGQVSAAGALICRSDPPCLPVPFLCHPPTSGHATEHVQRMQTPALGCNNSRRPPHPWHLRRRVPQPARTPFLDLQLRHPSAAMMHTMRTTTSPWTRSPKRVRQRRRRPMSTAARRPASCPTCWCEP